MEEQVVINGVDFTDKMPTGEVARLFAVDPRTIVNWAREGRLACIRTPGKHRRFSRAQVEELLLNGIPDPPEPDTSP